jgi:hypothetical protein
MGHPFDDANETPDSRGDSRSDHMNACAWLPAARLGAESECGTRRIIDIDPIALRLEWYEDAHGTPM